MENDLFLTDRIHVRMPEASIEEGPSAGRLLCPFLCLQRQESQLESLYRYVSFIFGFFEKRVNSL